jgi:hypothetical protein
LRQAVGERNLKTDLVTLGVLRVSAVMLLETLTTRDAENAEAAQRVELNQRPVFVRLA